MGPTTPRGRKTAARMGLRRHSTARERPSPRQSRKRREHRITNSPTLTSKFRSRCGRWTRGQRDPNRMACVPGSRAATTSDAEHRSWRAPEKHLVRSGLHPVERMSLRNLVGDGEGDERCSPERSRSSSGCTTPTRRSTIRSVLPTSTPMAKWARPISRSCFVAWGLGGLVAWGLGGLVARGLGGSGGVARQRS